MRSKPVPARAGLPAAAALAVVALGLVGCDAAGPRQGPSPPGLLGYGTPDVSAYVPADRASSLQAMRANCEGVSPPADPSATQGLPAACDQLRRTLHNQPGNATRPEPGSGPR